MFEMKSPTEKPKAGVIARRHLGRHDLEKLYSPGEGPKIAARQPESNGVTVHWL
jgi:hypothetical protein